MSDLGALPDVPRMLRILFNDGEYARRNDAMGATEVMIDFCKASSDQQRLSILHVPLATKAHLAVSR